MAIENAKTLNVRIRNKYDSYENWAKSTLILEAGEIATVYTTVNVEVGNGKIEQHPELLMKVGNGTDTFDKLPWLSAKAADIASWAKAANKPTYEAKEITGMEQYIADYVNDEMGISVDTNDVFRIIKVDDYNYKLQSKGKTDEAWADVADSAIVIPNDTAAIEALEDLVGDTKVATQITNAIAELKLGETYAALEHTHTKEEITDFAHKHEMEDVNGLADALAGLQAKGDYAAEEHTHEMTEVTGLGDAIADAKKAGTDAQTYAEGVAGDLAALSGKVGEVPADKTVVGMIAEAQEAATYDDTQVKADIDALEKLVGDTAVATQITTAIDEALKVEGADKYALAEHGHEIADVAGLGDELAKKVEKETGKSLIADTEIARLAAMSDGANKVEASATNGNIKIDGVETVVYTHPAAHAISEITGLQDALDSKQANIPENTYDAYGSASAALDDAKEYTDSELDRLVGDEVVATQIANAFKNEDGSAKYALAADLAAEVETARAAEQANAAAITKLNGNAETEGSVDYKIAQKFATLMENPDEAMNSIQELVDWTTEHATDALEMSNQVTANKNAIAKLNGGVEEDGSVAKQVAAGVTEAKGYTDAEVKKLAEGAVATNTSDIAALEKLVGDTAVATQITEAIDGALMVGEEGAKTEKYALATALAATDAEVAKKANDADLAAIAKTGSTDDLVQGVMTLVFDCGGAV